MKTTTLLSMVAMLLMIACQPQSIEADPAEEAFKANSETVKTDIENWENETMDYSSFAEDFYTIPTYFGASADSIGLEQMMEEDKWMLENFDFELISDLNLLPGVNGDSKKMDGSVRYYGEWKIIRPASDSTEEKSASIAMYVTYEFNEEGKITNSQAFGDFGGIMAYLTSED